MKTAEQSSKNRTASSQTDLILLSFNIIIIIINNNLGISIAALPLTQGAYNKCLKQEMKQRLRLHSGH